MAHKFTKSLIYHAADLAFLAYSKAFLKSYSLEDTWCLSSSPRGGSTWLANVISQLSGRITVWEPLHLGKNPSISNYGFDWANDITISEGLSVNDPRRRYIESLLSGNELNTRTLSRLAIQPRHFLSFKGILIKFVNAGLLIPWIAENYRIKCIHMVRHPCGVVASQLRHQGFSHINKDNFYLPKSFSDRNPRFLNALKNLRTREEVLALGWAMENYAAQFYAGHKLKIVRYEDLVADRKKVIDVLDFLNCPYDFIKLDDLLNADSTTTGDTSRGHAPLLRSENWRNVLLPDQQNRILSVVRSVGYEGIY